MITMNKLSLFLLAALIVPSASWAQQIAYTYDAAGNRTSRDIYIAPRLLNEQSEDETESLFRRYQVCVAPNPTNGYVQVRIMNFDETSSVSIALFDVAGVQLQTLRPTSEMTTLDLTSLGAGIYLLRITIDGESQTEKIVKE